MDYILTIDNRQLEIPSIDTEEYEYRMDEPTKTVDKTLIFSADSGPRLIYDRTTVPKANSELKYRELMGYLQGRAGQSETIYLEAENSTITGYIRVLSVGSQFRGNHGRRRTLNIKIWEA